MTLSTYTFRWLFVVVQIKYIEDSQNIHTQLFKINFIYFLHYSVRLEKCNNYFLVM